MTAPLIDTSRLRSAAEPEGHSPNGHRLAQTPPALALDHISLTFGGVRALTDVSLEVSAGEIRSIIGPNGAGKSSLLNVISGVYQPQSGSVHIDGVRYPRIDPGRLAAIGVARTFQNLALFDGLSVLDNIAIARSPSGSGYLLGQFLNLPKASLASRQARQDAEELMHFFGLESYRHRKVGTLPYGARKRVELARALIARPRLLLLDEPMAGMNHQDKHEMTQFIRTARDRFSTTVILIEHDLSVVMNLSDRIAVLDFGTKIADGTPGDVRTNEAVIAAYLGVDHDQPQSVTQ